MQRDEAIIERWAPRLREFFPSFFKQTPGLADVAGRCAILLHGSTVLGIDDAFSDLDLWVLVSDDALQRIEAAAGTRFFGFTLAGKPGHFNVERFEEAAKRVKHCDMERIIELRRCEILADVDNGALEIVAAAKRQMSESIRRAWFCYHYVEMRGFHRNCDTPIERGDALAVLQGLTPTLNHALRAAMVLDSEPYPYIKWLSRAAAQTPTGRLMTPLVEDVLDLLAADALRHSGPENAHPLSLKLREIRQLLIECAKAAGIDEPWLQSWWVHMTQAADGIRSVTW